MSKSGAWTWLVYMAGDNNLQGAGSTDLAEMKRIGSTDDVNVIVQFDTKANKTTRYRVEKNKLKVLREMRAGGRNPSFLTLSRLVEARLRELEYRQTPCLTGPRRVIGQPIPWAPPRRQRRAARTRGSRAAARR